MRLVMTTIGLALAGFIASAADNPLAGTWKLNSAKSVGPTPPCVQDGILKIRAEVYTGSPKPDSARERTRGASASETAKCATVFLLTPSPDGRQLTLTRPQVHPAFQSVFEKQ